jgi:Sel1 repeat
MWKSLATALAAAAAFAPFFSQADQADEFEHGMNTMWEVLWHQSGTPTRLVRWEQDLKVRIHGVNAAKHRAHTLKALRDTAAETGIRVIDVSGQPDAAQQANVDIEIVPNSALSAEQPCATRLKFTTETKLDGATMQMREGEAYRCAYHEAMHVMGVRGHPEGDTVLSYFGKTVDGLLPLDKAMLRAWYSPHARGGMTPFEVMPVLADELVRILPDRQQAQQARDRFFAQTVQDMQAFAEGKGDVPLIVKRCGKATGEGIRYGRMEMSYFLGVAYQEGVSVPRDETQAAFWLKRAADLGSRSAQARLVGAAPAKS